MLLDANPDLKQGMVEYANSNLNDLSGELMFNYIHTTALPSLLECRRLELGNPQFTMDELLAENRLNHLNMRTVLDWMSKLGYHYEVRKKTYYVDNHESPDTVKCRNEWTARYEWYREFHVDDHSTLQDVGATLHDFGGNLSVRRPPQDKPIISMGQDECIFKQYAHTPKSWLSPEGKRALIPKDDGMGVMISAFVTREWGFNREL